MPPAELNDLQEAVLEALHDARREGLAFIDRDELLQRVQETPGFDDTSHQRLGTCTKNLRRRGLIEEPRAGRLYITEAGIEALGALLPMPYPLEDDPVEDHQAAETAPQAKEVIRKTIDGGIAITTRYPEQEPVPPDSRAQPGSKGPESTPPEPSTSQDREPVEPTVKDCLGAYVSPTEWRNCPGCGSPPGKFHEPECPKTNAFQAGRIADSPPSPGASSTAVDDQWGEEPAGEESVAVYMTSGGCPECGSAAPFHDLDCPVFVGLPAGMTAPSGPVDWLDSGMAAEEEDEAPPAPAEELPRTSGFNVTRLQAVVHRPGSWMDDDDAVIVAIEDEGAGPFVRLSMWSGLPGVLLDSAEQIRAVVDTASAMLEEAEGRA